MDKTKAETGLSIAQIDAISLETGRAQALTIALHDNSPENDDISSYLFPMLTEQLEKISQMVLDCKLGGLTS